jgi:hypothetical protein
MIKIIEGFSFEQVMNALPKRSIRGMKFPKESSMTLAYCTSEQRQYAKGEYYEVLTANYMYGSTIVKISLEELVRLKTTTGCSLLLDGVVPPHELTVVNSTERVVDGRPDYRLSDHKAFEDMTDVDTETPWDEAKLRQSGPKNGATPLLDYVVKVN